MKRNNYSEITKKGNIFFLVILLYSTSLCATNNINVTELLITEQNIEQDTAIKHETIIEHIINLLKGSPSLNVNDIIQKAKKDHPELAKILLALTNACTENKLFAIVKYGTQLKRSPEIQTHHKILIEQEVNRLGLDGIREVIATSHKTIKQ